MSWFDASGFASLAKSALKEAQKTIDKALDIKEEEQKATATVEDTIDFFATWGIKNEDEKDKASSHKQQSSSIWGSFTGSFFENPKSSEENTSRSIKHSKSLQETCEIPDEEQHRIVSSSSIPENLIDRVIEGHQSLPRLSSDGSKVEDSSKPISESGQAQSSTSKEKDKPTESIDKRDTANIESWKSTPEVLERRFSGTELENEKKGLQVERRDSNTNHGLNRVSILSSESDKKSSESVEVLEESHSSPNTDCTTTPESDVNSVSQESMSASGAMVGLKVNSESVEILPDSLVTSPSSVEVLGDWKSDSSPFLSPMEARPLDFSPNFDRNSDSVTPSGNYGNLLSPMKIEDPLASCSDISPYESPMVEDKSLNLDDACLSTRSSSLSIESAKVSPESVEVIPDIDESEELSLADDSYTLASETTVMTVMEVGQMDQSKGKADFLNDNLQMHDSCPVDSRQVVSKSNLDTQLNLSLDSLKERHNLRLPLEPITTQPIRKSEILEAMAKKGDSDPFELLKSSSTIEPPDPDRVINEQKVETAECPTTDQYLMLTDSSCEGTLIESSSEDNATLVCTAEAKVPEPPLTTSSYVKNMLADAMVEKGEIPGAERQSIEIPRDNSPISSESRSDLVKIGSDQTSGHTSGDELETTTSSDIEIISSPNGDSSSTQSRQSPAKLQLNKGIDLLTKTLKTRGHSRELSEISVGSDEGNFEVDKLLKRIQEMTEILEARESKLIDVSRMNMELQEQNYGLKKQMDNIERRAEQNQDLTQITDEYTQRLSALERKFQQAIRERDTLRKQLEQLKQETATRLSTQEMTTMNAEKDEIIRELREEGEKLSKQQLQHSTIIKKLRSKEKENDITIKNQKEQIEEQSSELERLKRSLYAKEEVERSQIEAVHTLTAKTKKQEKEILALQEKLDNTTHKMEAYKKSLDAAKTELSETKQNLLAIEEELKQAVDNAGESCQLAAQLDEMKKKLRHAEETHVKREESLKQENSELLKRLETAEARSEELSESLSSATRPLLRQLEQLQANLSQKSNSFMKQEKLLSERNIELQTKLENLVEVDRSLKEENLAFKTKLSALESKLSSNENEKLKFEKFCADIKLENEKLAIECKEYQEKIEMLQQSHTNRVKELKREINALENKLSIEKAATDAEKRKNHAILEQQQQQQQQQSVEDELRLSPTLSIGRDSVSSVNSSAWPAFSDSVFDTASNRAFPMVYDGTRSGSNSTSVFENLQAQLKQRDGEIQQLQWELSRRNTERDALNMELSNLTLKVEDLTVKVSEIEALNENLNDIQTRYDALLQMYGEKVEENQELRLDLEDVKEMYKTQIDQLLKRDV